MSDRDEQAGREYAVNDGCPVRVGHGAQVWPWPSELVPFGKYNPVWRVIEPEPLLDLERDIDGLVRIVRRPMRHRQHQNPRVGAFAADSGYNDTRSVLTTFLLPPQMLAMPEVAVADDETRYGPRKCRHPRLDQIGV